MAIKDPFSLIIGFEMEMKLSCHCRLDTAEKEHTSVIEEKKTLERKYECEVNDAKVRKHTKSSKGYDYCFMHRSCYLVFAPSL